MTDLRPDQNVPDLGLLDPNIPLNSTRTHKVPVEIIPDHHTQSVSHKLANANATTTTDGHDTTNGGGPTGAGRPSIRNLNPPQPRTTNQGRVKDLGWHNVGDSKNLPEPLLGTFLDSSSPTDSDHDLSLLPPNDELFTLLRRFNKQISHVKATPSPPLTTLDLEISPEEIFTPLKFRTHLERFYTTVIIGSLTLHKHLVRLRSWNEYPRTTIFCLLYTLAWLSSTLFSTLSALLLLLLLYPPSRAILFPHVPPALIHPSSGNLQHPMSNVLASDSLTGAPESHPGEAIEQEAHAMVNSIIELAIGMASGQRAEDIANVKDKSGGEFRKVEHDKTKKAVSEAVWEEALPVMHMIARVADMYERVGNAVEPRWPFVETEGRRRFRGVVMGGLGVVILGGWVFSMEVIGKGVGFLFGFGLFGGPVMKRIGGLFDRLRPGWEHYLELKTTLLKGIPTNAQLTLTLLRIGERNRSPLPPPPGNNDPLPMDAHPTAGEGLDKLLHVSPEEVNAAIQPTRQAKEEADGDLRERTKSKGSGRILAGLKYMARGVVHTVRGADRVSARTRISQSARYRAGVVRTGPLPAKCSGPVRFPARMDGRRGYVVVYYGQAGGEGDGLVRNEEAVVGWVPGEVPEDEDEKRRELEGDKMKWRIGVGDVYEIQKIGGLGWKSKILVGWATDGEITDGLIIRNGAGTEYHLTAISLRDELFNRLIAIGEQMWEAW